MATIHRAVDTKTGRAVAIKLLRPEVGRDRDLAQRFRREALAATVLRHPNIVACLDTGTDDTQPYLVMELIEGEDLAARLRRGGRLAPAQAARIALDVARALGVAHMRGIVHRDVKPGNILLAADGRAMVTDFGIARLAADAEAALPGTTLGSVHYFSPEQARGAPTTPASDVYGLGLVLFEMLTGRRAWSGATTDAIALARIGAPAPAPRTDRPEVPAELDAVVRRALAPDPADRFEHGQALAVALERALDAAERPDPTVVTACRGPPRGSPAGAPGRRADPGTAGSRVVGAPRRRRRPALRPPGRRAPRVPRDRRGGRRGDARGRRARAGAGRAVAASEPVARASPSPTPRRPRRRRRADPDPATPTPASPGPTAVPPGEVSDVCEIFFDLPCGLGPGRYAPSRFEPEFDVELGADWSLAAHGRDIVAFTRTEGELTLAARLREVYPEGRARKPKDRVDAIVEAFLATDGVGATRPVEVRIDDRPGCPSTSRRSTTRPITLFATEDDAFRIEANLTTRIVVVDLDDDIVVLAIEPHVDHDLRDILDIADPVAGTLRWR